MSDEQRKDEDVEAHNRSTRITEEPAGENEDDEVEAHVRMSSARMDNVRHI
jgi:hypothetical protein